MGKKQKGGLDKQVRKATRHYLEAVMGWEVLEQDWRLLEHGWDYVCNDGTAYVFVKSSTGFGSFPSVEASRGAMEDAMDAWLRVHPDELADVALRVDFVYMNVIGDERAFVRHHKDVLADSNLPL